MVGLETVDVQDPFGKSKCMIILLTIYIYITKVIYYGIARYGVAVG